MCSPSAQREHAMVTTLVVIVVVLLIAAGVLGYLVERARQEDFPARPPRVIDLRPLPQERVRDYRADWVSAQARFVDDPDGAVRAADTLVERLMAERGYPPVDAVVGSDELADLTRDQAEVLRHYWAAHEVALSDQESDADTDALRRARVHYRMVVSALLQGPVNQPPEYPPLFRNLSDAVAAIATPPSDNSMSE